MLMLDETPVNQRVCWGGFCRTLRVTKKEIRDFMGCPEDDTGKFRIVRFVDMVMQSKEIYEDRVVFGL